MDQALCKTCAHYLQHYALDHEHIFRVYCGHCTFLRARRKKPDAVACDNYKPSESDESAFVSKEYLSVRLLEHMLKLELLPQIQDYKAHSKKG